MTEITKDNTFGRFLKFWRGVHGLSQEELAFRLDSSPRHISRLENGSGRPSETLVLETARVLQLGERDRNHLLVAAGFAPAQEPIDFHAPELRWLRKAMCLNLKALEPYPTTLMDGSTNLLMVNRAWVGFFSRMVHRDTVLKVRNNYDFLFANDGPRNQLSDWEDLLALILMALKQRALFTDDPGDDVKQRQLASHPSVPSDWAQRASRIEPMASFRLNLELDGKEHGFYSVNSTVGAKGPAEYQSEPRLTLNTLYPEDQTLDLSSLLDGDTSHPLLYQR